MNERETKAQVEVITHLKSVKGGSLADFLRATEGVDPSNVLIGMGHRYPNEATIEIYTQKMVDRDECLRKNYAD